MAFESTKPAETPEPFQSAAPSQAAAPAAPAGATAGVEAAGSAFASDRAPSSPVEFDGDERVRLALRQLGFSKHDATWAVSAVRDVAVKHDVGAVLRAAVHVLTASTVRA